MKVLIVPDKFKGTLTARKVADAIAKGWARVRPEDELDLAPMSDGGDGFGDLTGSAVGAQVRKVKTVDAAGRPVTTNWWWSESDRTAIVESALTIGIALLPPGRFHPFDLDTYGLGAVLRAARDEGATRVTVGIGGSATNDGGFGMARSLGWCFLDGRGVEIEDWTRLSALKRIERPSPHRLFRSVRVAVDVKNPLMGSEGCSRIYGPQKGLKPGDMKKAEKALGRLAEVYESQLGGELSSKPGAGAAGGLGFGLAGFLGGRFESGFDLFANLSGLKERIRQAGLVITAEGSIDRSHDGKGSL